MQLTKNFNLKEFRVSREHPDIAESLIINDDKIDKLYLLCKNILQPIRDYYGDEIIIISGYRDEYLNKLVGGGQRSLHKSGLAADFTIKNISTLERIFNCTKRNLKKQYGELIYYKDRDFIHISLPVYWKNQYVKIKLDK